LRNCYILRSVVISSVYLSPMQARDFDRLQVAASMSRIHGNGSSIHPLSEEATEQIKIRSTVRAWVEHDFGTITGGMLDKLASWQAGKADWTCPDEGFVKVA
jgi:hypothetical protein